MDHVLDDAFKNLIHRSCRKRIADLEAEVAALREAADDYVDVVVYATTPISDSWSVVLKKKRKALSPEAVEAVRQAYEAWNDDHPDSGSEDVFLDFVARMFNALRAVPGLLDRKD